MRKITLCLGIFLFGVAYDRRIFFGGRSDGLTIDLCHEIDPSQAEKEKKQKRKSSPIPERFKKFRRPVRSRCNYFDTHTRNVRFLDQRKIRRMCINH